MGNQQQGDFYVALENLRASIESKIDKVDTRQREDIKSLEVKTDKWQEEVRTEFKDVKNRLTVIETNVATKEKDTKTGWDRVVALAAIIISVITAFVIGIKP